MNAKLQVLYGCSRCEYCDITEYFLDEKDAARCTKTGKDITDSLYYGKIPDWCPLPDAPPEMIPEDMKE